MGNLVGSILSTTDVTTLAQQVCEAYKLTVSLDRDIAFIVEEATLKRQLASELHREIMFALEQGFLERRQAISLVHMAIQSWVTIGQHELADKALAHLMTLLSHSPTEDAIRQRSQGLYGRQ